MIFKGRFHFSYHVVTSFLGLVLSTREKKSMLYSHMAYSLLYKLSNFIRVKLPRTTEQTFVSYGAAPLHDLFDSVFYTYTSFRVRCSA